MKKPVLLFAIVVGLFVAMISLFVHKSGGEETILFDDFFALYSEDDIELAGEVVPVDDIVFRQALDRELTFLVMNIPQLVLYHKRASAYFPLIEKKLAEKNMPDDLKYLAVAESALRNDALSSAGAAGVWQFLATTAQEYDLRVDREIDERLHFEKATDAALEYLERAYTQFGSWSLAMASYNRGRGGVQRALDAQGMTSYYELQLPSETMRYIFRIVAIKYAMQEFDRDYEEKLFGDGYNFEGKTFSVSSTGGIANLYTYLSDKGYSVRRFYDLNPRVISSTLPIGDWEFVY